MNHLIIWLYHAIRAMVKKSFIFLSVGRPLAFYPTSLPNADVFAWWLRRCHCHQTTSRMLMLVNVIIGIFHLDASTQCLRLLRHYQRRSLSVNTSTNFNFVSGRHRQYSTSLPSSMSSMSLSKHSVCWCLSLSTLSVDVSIIIDVWSSISAQSHVDDNDLPLWCCSLPSLRDPLQVFDCPPDCVRSLQFSILLCFLFVVKTVDRWLVLFYLILQLWMWSH